MTMRLGRTAYVLWVFLYFGMGTARILRMHPDRNPIQNALQQEADHYIAPQRRCIMAPQRRCIMEQTVVKKYLLWEPQQIKETLYQWVNLYPEFVRLTSSQEAYGLPTAGGATDCPYDEDVDGCKNYILTIQDFQMHPEGSQSSSRLPEVFLSGELHGDERVGPTAVMEAATLLLEAAACEAKPRRYDSDTSKHSFNDKNTDWSTQLRTAKQCRRDLDASGTDDVHRKWLARLVSTRRIVIVPTTNALGYFQHRREENGHDPNRDFPYDIQQPTECMKTIAGRTANEIFRDHMFQLSLTFHGGMEVVGYEWGAPTWLNHLSPDDEAEKTIGAAYSQYGGGFKQSKPYDFGTMNDLVYYVRGGFEDWAYAGSWDRDRVLPCQPTTFGGYDAEKTKYNNSTLRVFNMLIETSNDKTPSGSILGTSLDVFHSNTTGNGHVSRNIRLSLLAFDAVQPYVSIVGINDLSMSDDIVPLVQPEGRSCQDTKAVMIPGNKKDVLVRWSVGGSFNIDSTELWYAKWDDIPEDVLGCLTQPDKNDIEKYFQKGEMMSTGKGSGFFSKGGPSPISIPSGDVNNGKEALGPVFEASIDVSEDFKTHEKLVVLASARVDQVWAKSPNKDFEPNVPPQSHIVNARTNVDWHHESAGKIIEGRLDWFSMPLTMVIGDYADSVGNQGARQVGTVELSNRFGETTGSIKGGVTPASSRSGPKASNFLFFYLFVVAAGFGLLFIAWKQFCASRHGRQPVSTAEYDDELQEGRDKFDMPSNYSDRVLGQEENGVELHKMS